MIQKPYYLYYFTRSALSRLLGVSRTNLAYHIRRLEQDSAFEYYDRKNVAACHREGQRKIHRPRQAFTSFAALTIANTYDTPRARSVSERLEALHAQNANRGILHNKVIEKIID